jgi:hypothetical protein
MADYTVPTTRATNDVVTASIWNTDLVENLKSIYDAIQPQFSNEKRIGLWLPIGGTPGTTTGVEWVEHAATAVSDPTWDSTNKWIYVTLTTNAASASYYRASAALVTVVDLLPHFSTAMAHVTTSGSVNVHRLGFVSDATVTSSEPAAGLYFRSTTGGNWFAVARNAASETATDTGVTASTNPKSFRIVVESAASIKYYIDGTLEHTETGANIPASGTVLYPAINHYAQGSQATCRYATWMSASHEVKTS